MPGCKQTSQRAAAAAALLLLLPLARALAEPPKRELPKRALDVIVVGGGMAGVTAARNLTDAGYKVLVLEGRDRSGGRLWAAPVPGGYVDLGAMWIHDAIPGRNELFDAVVGKGLALSPRQDYGSIATYSYATGQRTRRSSYLQVFSSWYSQLAPEMARMRSAAPADDRSVAAVYGDWLASNPQFSAADMGQANLLMHTNWQSLLNGNITSLSTARLGDAKSIPAVDVMLKDGFPAIVDKMKQGLDIQYNAVVTGIAQDAEGVTIATADGTAVRAPFAIVTPSLGVLKSRNLTFEPALPAAKLQAIEQMGFGVLDKVVLVFDKPFWPTDVDFILREMPDWSGRFSIFLNYWKLFKIPALVSIHVADTAKALEQQADQEVVGEALAVLRQMYGKDAVPQPVQSNVTRWFQDPFACGSYSYFTVGNQKNITATLAEPVGRILFAGEATSNKPATVLGAYLSGLREAARLAGLAKPQAAD